MIASTLRDTRLSKLSRTVLIVGLGRHLASVRYGVVESRGEAIFQKNIAVIGHTAGLNFFANGPRQTAEHMTFLTRFAVATDTQIQS